MATMIDPDFENSLYRSFARLCKGKTDNNIAECTGLSAHSVNLLRNGHISLINSRLYVVCQVFPRLIPAIINALDSDVQDITQIPESKEITKEEKIAIIKNLLDSL